MRMNTPPLSVSEMRSDGQPSVTDQSDDVTGRDLGNCLPFGSVVGISVRSAQDLQRVVTIVDKEHPLMPRSHRKSEEVSPVTRGVDLTCVDLATKRGRFDNIAVPSVHAEYIVVGRQ